MIDTHAANEPTCSELTPTSRLFLCAAENEKLVGGTFVAKVFRGKNVDLLYSQLKVFFPLVTVTKPRSSRNASIEAFVVCQEYAPPEGFEPEMLRRVLEGKITSRELQQPAQRRREEEGTAGQLLAGKARVVVPFVACGDLHGWDSEKTYTDAELMGAAGIEGSGTGSLAPVQPPIAPPYLKAMELIKGSPR